LPEEKSFGTLTTRSDGLSGDKRDTAQESALGSPTHYHCHRFPAPGNSLYYPSKQDSNWKKTPQDNEHVNEVSAPKFAYSSALFTICNNEDWNTANQSDKENLENLKKRK
jgi:hypothetical protein